MFIVVRHADSPMTTYQVCRSHDVTAAATPELSREDEPGCCILASQSPGRQLFPLFRPKAERKVGAVLRISRGRVLHLKMLLR